MRMQESVVDDPMYAPFAQWARDYGVDNATERFARVPGVAEFRLHWFSAVEKIESGGPPVMAAGRHAWYPGPTLDSGFWPHLRDAFVSEGWDDSRLESVDRSSTKVVAHTPPPALSAFQSRGLVVGFVQSGKTTNFTAVIAKLADERYDMAIVLSGIHNGLRKQTQERLEEQLVGGRADRWITLTSADQDFVSQHTAPSALLTSQGKVVLAVVKKNPAVLRRLIKWLQKDADSAALRNARVLIVDDEADQASVATATINPLIQKLLGTFRHASYVGYTATPFANVFIDPSQADLYPKDFILNLPRPDGYFGPESLFGRDDTEGDGTEGLDMIRRVDDSSVKSLRPLKQKDTAAFEPQLTDEIVEALRWFFLATAARRARGDSGHSTMLIHTSVQTVVHERFLGPLEAARAEVTRGLEAGDRELLEVLRSQWLAESARVPATQWGRQTTSFEDLRPHLLEVLRGTDVLMDNSRSEQRLDYSQGPVTAIVVGGNTLSRGLTLNGLVVSFFVRSATAYDTLLQMGRWFGYRPGYEELPRIWMTAELEDAFRHLAVVEHEMRSDIELYQHQNLNPLEFAVRIRTHPSLRITAKMGAAEPAEVSYGGRRVQTRYFKHRDSEWLSSNEQAAARLLTASARAGKQDDSPRARLFRDVPAQLVLKFLGEYNVHPDSPDMDTGLLTKYVMARLAADQPSLEYWNVAILDVEENRKQNIAAQLGPVTVGMVTRSRLKSGYEDRADIKTLMSKPDIALDLHITDAEARAASEFGLRELRNSDPLASTKALLVLYAIDPRSKPETKRAATTRDELNAAGVVVGLGIAFPGDADSSTKINATHVSVGGSLLDAAKRAELLGEEEQVTQEDIEFALGDDLEGEQ